MALNQQVVNVGAAPNDGLGDPIRTAFTKTNDNFTQLYSLPNSAPPISLVGTANDIPGMYAYSNTQFYYCYANYTGNTNIWAAVSQDSVAVTNITNGTSNVNIQYSDSNITVGVTGISNVAVFTPLGLDIKSNISANNVAANLVSAGNITISADTISSSYDVITIQPSGAPSGEVVIAGNLTVQGTTTTINSNVVTINDKVFVVANNANSAAAATNSGLQVGALNYASFLYNNAANSWVSTLGLQTAGNITAYNGTFNNSITSANLITNDITVSNIAATTITSVTISAGTLAGDGYFISNINGANVSLVPLSTNANYANFAGHSITSNTVVNNSQPNITSVGTLTSLTVSNILNGNSIILTSNINSPQIGNTGTLFTGTIDIPSNSQPNITQVGNLVSLNIDGGLAVIGDIQTAANAYITGTLYAGNIVGTISGTTTLAEYVTKSNQSNITSVGIMRGMTFVGNAVIQGADVISANFIGNTISTTLRGTIGPNSNAQLNITSLGNLVSLNVNGGANFGNTPANTVNISGNSISTGGASTTLNLGYNVIIPGNLNVQGTTVTVNSNTVTINDLFINVANNASTSALANGGGIGVGPVGSEYASLYYVAVTDSWNMDAPLNVAGNISAPSFNWANGSPVISSTGALSVSTISASGNITSNANVNAVGATFSGNVTAAYFNGTATSAQYADLAENYLADAKYLPGTVVSFGGPKEVTVSITNMDALVAGVVSTSPAYTMNSGLTGDYTTPIALMGRVPCRVTGTVTRGAMMVSNGDGTARAEATPVMGSVIGKALEAFNGGIGVIEIVVGKL